MVEAVDNLKAEGHDVELVLVEQLSNLEILELILSVDLVIDQLIVGWYAMFAIESLVGKPVVCFLRDDLFNLYRAKGLISPNEPPLINVAPLNLKEELRELILFKISFPIIPNADMTMYPACLHCFNRE